MIAHIITFLVRLFVALGLFTLVMISLVLFTLVMIALQAIFSGVING